jgi:DNA polymerase-4
MDAFFASVEQAVNPIYRGKPLIIGSRGRKYNTVVAACSYEAKAFGVESGMPSRTALELCPHAEFLPADSAKYIYTSDNIWEFLKSYSNRMERASIDEFYLDLSHKTIAEAESTAKEIKEKIRKQFSITGSIGIAPAKIVAKIAAKAHKPDGLLILEEEDVLDFLRDLPVEKVPGIGPRLTQYLSSMSIFTCAELAGVNVKVLMERFGKLGFWLSEVSHGRDTEEVEYWDAEDQPPKSISHSYTLQRAISRRQDLQAWIRMLCEMVAYRLRKERLEAEIVHLCLRDNFCVLAKEKKFPSASSDPGQLYKRSLYILESFKIKDFYVRALGVSASCLVPQQGIYLFGADKRRNELLYALDKINERFGDWSIYPAVIKEIKN